MHRPDQINVVTVNMQNILPTHFNTRVIKTHQHEPQCNGPGESSSAATSETITYTELSFPYVIEPNGMEEVSKWRKFTIEEKTLVMEETGSIIIQAVTRGNVHRKSDWTYE